MFIDEAGVGPGRRGSSERRVVNVEVGEGFGRSSLVSIDVVVPASDELAGGVATEGGRAHSRGVEQCRNGTGQRSPRPHRTR